MLNKMLLGTGSHRHPRAGSLSQLLLFQGPMSVIGPGSSRWFLAEWSLPLGGALQTPGAFRDALESGSKNRSWQSQS